MSGHLLLPQCYIFKVMARCQTISYSIARHIMAAWAVVAWIPWQAEG
jgi:hypothetical protein